MNRGESHIGPEKFTKDEINFARRKGVIISMRYSQTLQENYLANTCLKCGSFAGAFHLYEDYFLPALYGDLQSKVFDVGYHCDFCAEEEFNNSL